MFIPWGLGILGGKIDPFLREETILMVWVTGLFVICIAVSIIAMSILVVLGVIKNIDFADRIIRGFKK